MRHKEVSERCCHPIDGITGAQGRSGEERKSLLGRAEVVWQLQKHKQRFTKGAFFCSRMFLKNLISLFWRRIKIILRRRCPDTDLLKKSMCKRVYKQGTHWWVLWCTPIISVAKGLSQTTRGRSNRTTINVRLAWSTK